MNMRYTRRLWRRAMLAQLLVLALTASLCAAVAVWLLVGEAASNRRSCLEAMDQYAQKVLQAAQRELVALGGEIDWVELARMAAQVDRTKDALEAHDEITTRLIENTSGESYFETMYLVTPQRLFTSRFSTAPPRAAASASALQWLRSGENAYDRLTVQVGGSCYLVAQLDAGRVYQGPVDNFFLTDHSGARLFSLAPNQAMEEELSSRSAQGAAERLCRVDGRLCFLTSFTSISYDRRYSSLIPLEDVLRGAGGSLRPLALVVAAQALAMAPLLWAAAYLAMRPLRRLAEQARQAAERGPGGAPSLRGGLRGRIMAVFLLTLLPAVITPPAAFRAFSASAIDCTQEFQRQAAQQAARGIGFDYARLLRQADKTRTNAALMDWLERPDGGGEDLRGIALELLSGLDGVSGLRLYDAEGNVLLCTTPFAPLLTDGLLAEYADSYRPITVSTANLRESDLAVLVPLRVTRRMAGRRLFSCVGFAELHAEAAIDGNLASAARSGQTLWYIYDRSAWRLLDVPMTAPYRNLIEGMGQGKLLAGGNRGGMRPLDTTALGSAAGTPGKYLLVTEPVQGTSWQLVALMSSDVVSSAERLLGGLMIVLTAVLALLFTGLSYLFATRFMRSARLLEDYFTAAVPGRSDLPAALEREGEITLIARGFQNALRRIHELEQMERRRQEENLYLEKRKREAEIVALQSQLDSHLISNLFASMQLLLRMGETRTLGETLQVVARFFRNELAMDSMDVPLGREIALTRSYIEVQKTRFHERLDVEWLPYDEELEKAVVPKFIMQPVIENAIKHGMTSGQTLRVRVGLERRGESLVLTIANDGLPVAVGAIEPINQHIDSTAPTTHIGLRNIMERLRLRYGARSGVRLGSDENGWIAVTIWLPCEEENHGL